MHSLSCPRQLIRGALKIHNTFQSEERISDVPNNFLLKKAERDTYVVCIFK